jgi:hypothetical protein
LVFVALSSITVGFFGFLSRPYDIQEVMINWGSCAGQGRCMEYWGPLPWGDTPNVRRRGKSRVGRALDQQGDDEWSTRA